MVSIAIMGHGVVGSGVAEIFTTHKQKLYASIGEEVYVKKILDLREFPDSPLADRFTKNFEDIINDLEIRVVVEVMGGLNPAYDFVKRCLKAGKSVVTSNKELVAAHGAELLEISKETNTNFLFEASVGGGIPNIRPMSQNTSCTVSDRVPMHWKVSSDKNFPARICGYGIYCRLTSHRPMRSSLLRSLALPREILPLISKVTMLAVRFVFLHLLHTESMFIPTLYIQRALQKLRLKM